MHFSRLLILGLALLMCTACASDGSFRNPFATQNTETSGAGYYFSEFSDVPIPNELSEKNSDTFITFAASGTKCGVQRFTGRVDVVSLMNTMRQNMSGNGWTLRSLLRAKESVLVFEKTDRVVALHIVDGMITTEMRVFMTSRLDGDSGAAASFPSAGGSETPL